MLATMARELAHRLSAPPGARCVASRGRARSPATARNDGRRSAAPRVACRGLRRRHLAALHEALALGEAIDSLPRQRRAFAELSATFEAMGDFGPALQHHKRFRAGPSHPQRRCSTT
jgi:hypothetical protein